MREYDRALDNALRILDDVFLFDDPWAMEPAWTPVKLSWPIDWRTQPANDPEWTFMLARHGFVVDLARAYDATSDSRFAKKACALIGSFMESVPFGRNDTVVSWRSLDSAIRVDNWLTALPSLISGDVIGEEFMALLRESVREHASFLASVDTPFSKLSNWGLISNAGLYHAAIWLGDNGFADIAVNRISECVELQILADGVHWEQSPMYHAQCLRALLRTIRLARRHRRTIPAQIADAAKRMCQATLASMKPDGRQFLQGDSDDTSIRGVLSEGALLFRLPELKYAGEPFLEFPFASSDQNAYDDLEPHPPLFLSKGLTESGNYYLRTGWQDDATVVHFRCGSLGSGHGHADLLHVDLVGLGRDLLVDSGRYTYVDCEERRYFRSGSAHNTILLDGSDPFEMTGAWECASRAIPLQGVFVERGSWSYCSGSSLLERSYLVRRQVLVVGPRLVCIFDTFFGVLDRACRRTFHFAPECSSELSDGCVTVRNGDVVASLWIDRGETSRLVPSRYAPHYNILENNTAVTLESAVSTASSRCTIVQLSCKGTEKTVRGSFVEEIPVFGESTGQRFPDTQARAFVSHADDVDDTTILFCSDRCGDGVEMLRAGALLGHGTVIVRQGARQEVFEG